MTRCRLACMVAICLMAFSNAVAQPQPAPDGRPDQIVEQWFDRMSAIGSDLKAIDELIAMYEPDALHITGPSTDQRGTATYRGHEGLRVLFGRIAATEER